MSKNLLSQIKEKILPDAIGAELDKYLTKDYIIPKLRIEKIKNILEKIWKK